MVKVKICGITNARDACAAASCGADALGFNFVKGTPRYIEPEQLRAMGKRLPPLVFRVGVFANERAEVINYIANICRLHYVQLHGDEPPDFCAEITAADIIKALRVSSEKDLARLSEYKVCAFLLDAKVKGKLGGTGKTISPQIAKKARKYGPIILAGGLNPDNVAGAIKVAQPIAVDAASGVEESPRIKSHPLMAEFISNAKNANRPTV